MTALRALAGAVALAGVTCAAAAGQPAPAVSRYVVEVELLPSKGQVVAATRLTILRDDYLDPELSFRLHDHFSIDRLEVDGTALPFTQRAAVDDPLRPATTEVAVQLPEDLRRPELELEVAYHGALAKLPQLGSPEAGEIGGTLDDEVSERRVELSYYSSWYPQVGDFGAAFAVDLAVTLPARWTVVCSGERQGFEDLDGRRRTRWLTPSATDLVVVASPDLEVVSLERGEDAVEIYHTRLPAPFIDREADNVRRTLALYAALLGEPQGRSATVRVVFSPRSYGQGGYSRVPMLVLSEGLVIAALHEDPRLSLLHGIAHEAAHFWWRFGTGQGDWMNESFAEYFALLAVERIDSPSQYQKAIARAAAAAGRLPADAPSLAAVPPDNRDDGTVIRYQKGALMLSWIRSRLGDDAFFAACRAFYEARLGRPTSTADFRAFWSARLGAEGAPTLERWLTSSGGVPDLD